MSRLTRRLRDEVRTSPDVIALWRVNKYLWLSIAFVAVYLPLAQSQGRLTVRPWVAWVYFAVALGDAAARSYMAYRRGGTLSPGWAWFFTVLDVTLISVAVAITGGIDSDFWLLYFVVMIFESLYAKPIQKRMMDLLVGAGYLLAALPHLLQAGASALSAAEFGRILFARLYFLILVGALVRRITSDTDARNRELALLHEQMATAEERARIAREIHDGLGHALVSGILRLELCARLLRKDPEEAEAILKEEIPALRAAWNESRDLAFHLHPWETDALKEGGLVDTLRRHTGRFAERTGIIVTLTADDSLPALRPEAAFGLTRIVQEALTNAVKHAHASRIAVTLTRTPDGKTHCLVEDDGMGFALEDLHVGVGLQAMRERAQSLGGTLNVESAPNQGTRVVLILPG